MTSLTSKFLHRVRIFGGEFDASARATHRKAAFENVSGATIERKTMSTKTTLKRVALVAVAATGFGLMSAVPSNAATQADTFSASAITSSTTIGAPVSTVLTSNYIATAAPDAFVITASLVSGPAGNVALPVLTAAGGTDVNSAHTIAGLVDTVDSTLFAPTLTTGFTTATITPAIAGTYVIRFTPSVLGGGTLNSAAITWTVTVAAVPVVTAANSTSFTNLLQGTAGIADVAVAAPRAATVVAGSQAASIVVTSRNNVPTDLSASTALTATISGPGLLGFGTVGGVAAIVPTGRAITGAVGNNVIGVFADGTAGTATITISAGSTVLSTETVVFYGAVATLASTVVSSVIATTGGLGTGAITAIAKDSNGNVVAGAMLYITSSDLTVLNASYLAATGVTDGTGKAFFNLPDGLKAGSVTLTVGNGSSLALTTISAAPVSVRVGSQVANAVTLLFDKNSYVLGEAAVLTVALVDAAGAPVANGTYANVFTGATVANFAVSGALPGASITIVNGLGTLAFPVNMPVFAADVVVSGTGGTSLPTAAQVAVMSSVASVANSSSDAATDAANAATDAANYAADAADAATTAAEEATAAAQAAQESADAATAAVVELSTKVSALVDALRAQVTSLGNYVAKVAAALGRVGTALNKVLYNQKMALARR